MPGDIEGAGPRYDQHPVLPGEAADLGLHVDQCGRRYVALLQYLNALSRRFRGMRFENWIYRIIALPLMIFIAVKLWELVSIFSPVMPK